MKPFSWCSMCRVRYDTPPLKISRLTYGVNLQFSTPIQRWGEDYLRISAWHLLINLKNKYLLKKLLKWANKKWKNLYFLHLCIKHLDDMIYSSWDIVRKTEVGNYWSFFALLIPLKTKKIRILKKWKKITGDTIILHVYQKPQSYEVRFLR